MKNIFQLSFVLSLALGLVCCTKKDTEFKDFLQAHEIVYPGVPAAVSYRAGNSRVMLLWKPSPDPGIKKYLVYWNNRANSSVVTAGAGLDTMRVLISNLQEYVYSFTLYSVDAVGNRSIPMLINNVRVFGPLYSSGLLNRAYNATNPYVVNANNSVTLNFNAPDTINVATSIRYTNNAGNLVTAQMSPDSSTVTLADYKFETPVLYKSSYIPQQRALDTFYVAAFDTFPNIIKPISYMECNKALFSELHLPNDVGTYKSGTSISKLWDGSQGPQGYPNIFHSDGGSGMPHIITFDMGATYNNLGRIEETGRNCCNNPDKFEVWGTADITNATTTLKAYDSGWPEEAVSKGWTLLKDVVRTDDGINAKSFDLIDNPPPVRYIRIRIKHVTTGDNNYSNLSELTLWNKQ